MPATTRKRKPRPVEEDEDEVTSESEEDPTTSSGEEEDDVDDQGQPNGGTARRGETPEQKRLRLAKAYLKSMEVDPASRGGKGEDGEGDEAEGEDRREDLREDSHHSKTLLRVNTSPR